MTSTTVSQGLLVLAAAIAWGLSVAITAVGMLSWAFLLVPVFIALPILFAGFFHLVGLTLRPASGLLRMAHTAGLLLAVAYVLCFVVGLALALLIA